MKIVFLLQLLFFVGALLAQEKKKRHDFAKTYVGVDFILAPDFGESQFMDNTGNMANFQRTAMLVPAINIGGTHFWGHADFYVSITTAQIKFQQEAIRTNHRFGTFTGFRVYPFRLKDYSLRPFLGYKFSVFRYNQTTEDGALSAITSLKSTLDIGLAYRLPFAYFVLSYNFVIDPKVDLYISRNQQIQTNVAPHFITIGLNWMIEATNFANKKAYRHFDEVFAQSNKDGFFIGIGPSSAFPTIKSSYIEQYYPFLDQMAMPTIFPDAAIGYHFAKPDLVLALSFRPMAQTRTAHFFTQKINRYSMLLETYKVLGDFHGFSPFFGAGISYEYVTLKEEDKGRVITQLAQHYATPVLTIGWDIRPSKRGDWWVLRTNMRYAPLLNIHHNNELLSLQHFEFNFIQFVFYPQRLSAYIRYIKEKGSLNE